MDDMHFNLIFILIISVFPTIVGVQILLELTEYVIVKKNKQLSCMMYYALE